MTTEELIYVGDPLCSWCWGIAPELDRVTAARPDLPFSIVLGGLRPGPNAREVDEQMAASLARHWRDVSERSGQPFDFGLLEQRGWLYDTEPACRAVMVMRELDGTQAWPLFKAIQRLFYVDGVVPAGRAEIEGLVSRFDVDHDAYWTTFESDAAVKATWRDFAQVHKWGIGGFPTVIYRNGEQGHVVTRGYTTADRMLGVLDSLAPLAGETCGPDVVC